MHDISVISGSLVMTEVSYERSGNELFRNFIISLKWKYCCANNFLVALLHIVFIHSCVNYVSYERYQMKDVELSFPNMCHLLFKIKIKVWLNINKSRFRFFWDALYSSTSVYIHSHIHVYIYMYNKCIIIYRWKSHFYNKNVGNICKWNFYSCPTVCRKLTITLILITWFHVREIIKSSIAKHNTYHVWSCIPTCTFYMVSSCWSFCTSFFYLAFWSHLSISEKKSICTDRGETCINCKHDNFIHIQIQEIWSILIAF